VSDALIGHHVSCPECGQAILVSAAPKAVGKTLTKTKQRTQSHEATVHISPGMISLLGVLLVGTILTMTYRLGPARVQNQWLVLRPKAEGEVNDVITFASQAYFSHMHLFVPNSPSVAALLDAGVHFDMPFLLMSMPDKVRFYGVTQAVPFTGYYHPATGEIEAQITYGGRMLVGLQFVNVPTGTFSITGRDVNGFPQAEMDGTPLKILPPPKLDQ
jgi:hypothetical protein